MNIKVNILEIASDLAHEIMCAKFEDDDNLIYGDCSRECLVYSEKAQDLFNVWYDYYYDFLDKRKENEE